MQGVEPPAPEDEAGALEEVAPPAPPMPPLPPEVDELAGVAIIPPAPVDPADVEDEDDEEVPPDEQAATVRATTRTSARRMRFSVQSEVGTAKRAVTT